VLITGANQGIGFEIARKLAADNKNYHVLLSGRRKDAVWDAAATLQSQGLSVEPLLLDVTSDDSIAAAVQAIEAAHGRLDVLVVNGAITGASFEGSTRAQLRHVYETNVFGAAAVTEASFPLLERGAAGPHRVVFVSTNLSSLKRKADPSDSNHGIGGWMPYATSKTALNMLLLQYAARYHGEPRWKFNLCCPGYCATNLNSYAGFDTPANGAVVACRLAADEDLGGPSATFTDRDAVVPW